MLNINETAHTFDLGELLRAESGMFEAVSPRGETYTVVCRQGQSITSLKPASQEGQRGQWRVRKIAELRPSEQPQQQA